MKKISLFISTSLTIFNLSSCSFISQNNNSSSTSRITTTISQNTSNITQLSKVENINYDDTENLLSWDSVNNANAYNVSVNGEITQVNDNYFYIELTTYETVFLIQALDTTNTYLSSEWSDSYIFHKSLVDMVNAFAESLASRNITIKKVLSVSAEDNYLYTNIVYQYLTKDYFCTWRTDYGQNIENLKDVLEMQEAKYNTVVSVDEEIKDYDTASSFLARNEYSEQIQSLVDQGYSLSFVTSQTYEYSSATAGLNGLLKATKSGDYRYFDINVSINVGSSGSESLRYTIGVEDANVDAIRERSFRELTGDFYDYAVELDELLQSSESE